jgi:hypothetical protein
MEMRHHKQFHINKIRRPLEVIHSTAALLAVAAGIACSGCASRTAMPFEEGASRYRFEFRLERMAGETGACAAAVRVRDLEAKRDLAIPLFSAAWGKVTDGAATDSTYGAVLSASVDVAADGSSARFHADLKRDDRLLASRTAAIPVKVVKPAPQRTYR